jgi:DNA-binding MarR family transcriptional regulator
MSVSFDPVDPPPESEPELAAAFDAHLGYQLRRASAAVLGRLASALAPFGLRITEATVLLLVDENPDATQSALGRRLGIHRANMAPLAAGLAERGLIERSRTEGRAQGLRTTPAGQGLAAQIRRCMEAQDAEVAPALPPQARAALIELLKQMWQR